MHCINLHKIPEICCDVMAVLFDTLEVCYIVYYIDIRVLSEDMVFVVCLLITSNVLLCH